MGNLFYDEPGVKYARPLFYVGQKVWYVGPRHGGLSKRKTYEVEKIHVCSICGNNIKCPSSGVKISSWYVEFDHVTPVDPRTPFWRAVERFEGFIARLFGSRSV